MICLDNTDTLEAGASVDAVVDCTVHGLVGTTFTNLYSGQLSDTNPTVIYTAGAAISIVSVTMVNTHSAAVTVDLYLDPANGGNPRRLIPKTLSLGIGYSMHFDGQRCSVMDASGNVQTLPGNHVHDGDTLQLDGVNSDGGAFAFTTSGAVTFGQDVITTEDVKIGDGKYIGSASDPDAIQISAAGEVVMNAQPAFLAVATAQADVTGDATTYTVTYATEIFDQGANFDGTSTFTAPVAGRYYLGCIFDIRQIAAGHTIGSIAIATSNRTHYPFYGNPAALAAGGTLSIGGGVFTDMDAADTATIALYIANGAKACDVTATTSSFFGHLVC